MHKIRPRRLRPGHTLLCLSLFLALCIAYSTARSSQDDDEVVRVNTDLVVLNVTVVDENGKYVHGLQQGDFKLYVDGREQVFQSFSREETPFAAAVLLDTSGSMEQRMMLARSAAIRFLDELREEDVAAVYRFDHAVEIVQEFSSSRDLGDFAYNLRAKGMTALNDAILRAADDLNQRPEHRRAIILLSDGADNKSGASADKALDHALAANATIYTVDMSATVGTGARNQANAVTLRNFSSKSGGRYVATPGGTALRDAFKGIAEELSNQYTLGFALPASARDGEWHKLEVKLSRPELTVRTRKGYRAPKS